jgi:negative regulator of flagellin synthesis FlgM
MTINKIYGNSGIGPIDKNRTTDRVKASDKTSEPAAGDRVQFSDVLQQVNRTRQAEAGADVQRAEKLQTLKEQIADGSYRPDSTKVAASLLKFLAGSK